MRAGKATLALLACAALAFSILPSGASLALTVRGQVLKGQERLPVPGQEVQLHVVRGEEELKGTSTTTDSRGAFQFPGLKQDPALSYYISTEYQNAFYTEGPLAVDQGPTVTKDLAVYEVGRDISSVRVQNQHIIIERQPDGLHVTEILIFENKGRTAYLGTGVDHAENAGVRIGLPASIDGFQQGIGGDPQTTIVRGRELSSERPIPPGVRPFSFTYKIPLSGRVDLSHRLYFPTETFVILLDDPKLKLESKAVHFSGTRNQGGKQYAMYSGSDFGVGQEVAIRIGGAGFFSNPKVYPWLAAPFLIAGALWFAARGGRRARGAAHARGRDAPTGTVPQAAAVPPPQAPAAALRPALPLTPPKGGPSNDADFRKAYLHLIAALDEGLERGEFTRETHALIRQNLKRRLQALLAQESASGVR